MIRVTVSESVLRWAIERSSQPEALEKKFPRIFQWLKGESKPTFHQLEELAKTTHTPFGYLFLEEPPEEELPIPFFRTIEDEFKYRPSPNLIEMINMIEQRQMWMREYLIDQGCEKLPFVGSKKIEDAPEDIAFAIREALGLSEGWAQQQPNWTQALRYLQFRIEDIGINIMVSSIVGLNTHRKLDPNEFRGFVLVDEYAPFVFLNGADGKAAQMFTLAHELSHIWIGKGAVFDLRELQPAKNPTEIFCNKVAAEFLVPKHVLQEFWPSIATQIERFQIAAQHFKVSEIVIARRALDLGLIKRQEFLKFYEEYRQIDRKGMSNSQKGGDFYAVQTFRLGRYFAEAVVHAVKEGKLLYQEAYKLTGLYGATFDKYASYLESRGAV